jgi:hypothetical protein
MVEYWYPYAGHPDGESDIPWFRVVDGKGFRSDGNPAGPSDIPCFGVIDGWAYPAVSLPDTAPTFEVVGSFVYPPQGTAWFRIRSSRR